MLVRQYGSTGDDEYSFDQPTGAAVTKDGTLIVADAINKRVQVMKVDGTPLRTLGQGLFSYPYGCCLSLDEDIVFVSDYGMHCIMYVGVLDGDAFVAFSLCVTFWFVSHFSLTTMPIRPRYFDGLQTKYSLSLSHALTMRGLVLLCPTGCFVSMMVNFYFNSVPKVTATGR